MEIVSGADEVTRIQIEAGQTRELGRAHGLNPLDKTISRRHISVSVSIPLTSSSPEEEETRLQFQVLGSNPIYVLHHNNNGEAVKIFRRFESGQMGSGDMFCASAKDPVWYTVSKYKGPETVRQNVQSAVDPVKEFGFVVMGHEFDPYPMKMIRDFKNWDWFLEEPSKDSGDNDDRSSEEGRRRRRKRKKGEERDDHDEDWTGDSLEDGIDLINKAKKAQRPKRYTTRSKDLRGKSRRDASQINTSARKKSRDVHDDHVEDGDDETLGGFIVNDENLEEEEEEIGDEEEEESGNEYDDDDE